MTTPSLAAFINDLYTGSVDPATAYFLPSVALEQTLPVDPLQIGDCEWGDLAALAPALPSQLCAAITPGTIAAPGTQAMMSLTDLQVVGGSNVLPSPPPAVSGTTVTARFAFGSVTSVPHGIIVPPYLAIQGTFTIALSCCRSGSGSQCEGAPGPQQITGTFAAGFVGAVASLTLEVESSFAVTATGLSLTAGEIRFAFQTESPLLFAGPINTLLQTAFNGAAGPRALALVNERLGGPGTLTGLGSVLTPAFQSLSDPSMLAFAVSTLYLYASDPASSWYLPTMISAATHPVLEPYAAGGWDMADVAQWYPAAGTTICASIGADKNEYEIQTPGSDVPLGLSEITISGTSNMMVMPMLTIGHTIWAIVACNAVQDQPLSLTVSGNFTLGVTCCAANRRTQSCTEPARDNLGTGTFVARFATAMVSAKVTVSSPDRKKLVGTVDAVYFRCDPNVDDPGNITFDIDITSVPAGNRQDWDDMAAGIFNSARATSAIVDQVRTRLNSDQVRARLSEIVTAALQSILADDAELAARITTEAASRSPR